MGQLEHINLFGVIYMNNLVGNIFKKLDDLAVRIVSTAIVLFGSINIASAETIFGGAKIYKFFTSYDDIIAAVIVIVPVVADGVNVAFASTISK